MLSSYHKLSVNRPTFSQGQHASNTVKVYLPSLPPNVSRMDVMVISMQRKEPVRLSAALNPNGLVTFDEAAIARSVSQGQALLPELDRALRTHAAVLASPLTSNEALLRAVHTLRTTERLADSGVSIDSLYPALSTLDSIPNPLLTIYLAGAYSKLNRPEPLGWALMTLARLGAQQAQGNVSTPHLQKAHEEVGKVVSFQLQKFPAMANQVMGWLQTFGPQKTGRF